MDQQNQQSIQEQTKSKPQIKINLKHLVIVAVFGLTAVGGILLLKSMQPAAPVTQTPLPDHSALNNQQSAIDTSDWQTYHNDEFGFEVKYPADWSIIGETTGQPAFSPDGKVKIYTRLHVSGTPEYIYALAYEDEQECAERILEPGEQVVAPGAACPVVKTKETKEIDINGIRGYFKERESGSLSAYLPRPDKRIAIELTTQDSNHKDVFDQILSTFRFVDSPGAQEENIVEVDLGKGEYANLKLDTYSNPISELKKGSHKDEACKRLLEDDANWKSCEELQVVNASGWRAVRFVFMPEVLDPSPYLWKGNSQYFESKQAHSLGLFYENHYFEINTNATVTPDTKIKIASPKNLFVMQGERAREGVVSSDVVSLELQQPIWYPNQGKLASPQLQEADFVSTFEIEVPKAQLINGASPIYVRATFADGTVKKHRSSVGKILSKGYILSTASNVRSSFDKNMLSRFAQTDITNFIIYVYNGDIYRTDLGKTKTTQLTAHKGIWSLEVSPDQKYIAYIEKRGVEWHPGAPVYFSGSVYFKIIDAQDGKLIWSFPIELKSSEGYGTYSPYINFFWDVDNPQVYLSINPGVGETSYLSYNIQTREKKLLAENEFNTAREKHEEIKKEKEKKLVQSAKELITILQFPLEYDVQDRRFYVSPNGKKIAFLLLPRVCSYGRIVAPLIVYDTEAQTVFIADGPSTFGPTIDVRWVNNDNLLFTNGIITRIDFTKHTISPFLRSNWIYQENQCYELASTADSLCDQDVEFFFSYPLLQDYCSA